MKFKILLTVIFSYLLSSCSSSNANTEYKNHFNFSKINSYSIYSTNSTVGEFQNISFAMRNGIELAIEQSLDDKGYKYLPVEESDVVVGYHLIGRNRQELKKYNESVKYCGYCLKALEASKSTIVSQRGHQSPGLLIIDLIDTGNSRSIWRSSYFLKIKDGDSSKKIQLKIAEAVDLMFENIPKS